MQIKSVSNGKEINLTSEQMQIISDFLNVTKDGKIKIISDAKFDPSNPSLDDYVFKILSPTSSKIRTTIQPNTLSMTNGTSIAGIQVGTLLKPEQDYTEMRVVSGNNKSIYLKANNNYAKLEIKGNKTIQITDDLILTPKLQITDAGTCMYGKDTGHKYMCHWTGTQLQFWVDNTNVGTLSDKRLKTEIQDIDEDFIKIIDEVEMKQFKVANRNGLISFGILAQDLMEIFGKYNKNPFDYEIVQKTQYKIDDETIYYTINYEQFLILKQKATDIKLQKQQEQIDILLKEIQELKGVNDGKD